MWSSVFKSRDWFYIVPVALLALVLGLVGFLSCHVATCQVQTFGEALFRTIDLIRGTARFTLGHDPWELVIAQLLMPLAFAIGAIKLVILNMRRDLRVMMVRRMRGHAIVCGTGDTGKHIAKHLADAGQAVVVVALDAQSPNALASERRGIPVLQGDAMEMSLLRIAGLNHAASLFVACGSDAVNIEIGLRALAASSRRKTPTPLVVMPELRSEWLYHLVQSHRTALQASDFAYFRLFNLNANAARLLLRSAAFQDPHTPVPSRPHIMLVGQGQALNEVLVQIVSCNFALPGQRLSVSLVGADTGATLEALTRRYPGLAGEVDITGYDMGLSKPADWAALGGQIAETPPLAIVVDVEAEETTMKIALELRRQLDSAGLFGVPVCARIWQQHRLGDFIHGLEATPVQAERLVFFGDLATLTGPEQLLQQSLDLMATATHRVHQDGAAAADWLKLAEMYKQSNRAFADHIPVKLGQIGLKLASGKQSVSLGDTQIESLAQAEHWRWCLEKRLLGWSHDPVRDDMRKHHPLLLDWEALPEAAKDANRRMVRAIPAIAEAAGLCLVPKDSVP